MLLYFGWKHSSCGLSLFSFLCGGKQTLCFLLLSGYGRRQHGLWEMDTYPTKYADDEKEWKSLMISTWLASYMDADDEEIC